MNIYDLTVSLDQESRNGFAEWFRLRVSHEAAVP